MGGTFFANIGTPFVWGSCFMFVVGNALIGVFEAWLISRRFGIERERLQSALLFANFFTGLIGFAILPGWLGLWAKLESLGKFYATFPVIVLAWLSTFALTVLLEWPIVRFIFRKAGSQRNAGWAILYANAASYAAMALLSLPVSSFGGMLYLKSRTVAYKIGRPMPLATVIYVKPDGRTIGAIRLEPESGMLRDLGELGTVRGTLYAYDTLFVVKSPNGNYFLKNEGHGDAGEYRYEPAIRVADSQVEHLRQGNDGWWFPATLGPSSGRQRHFGPPEMLEFSVRNMYWPMMAFHVTEVGKGRSYSLALETPFLAWHWRNQIVLPDGWCLAELDGTIYLIDLRTKEIGMVCRGTRAAAILGAPELPKFR